MKYCLYLLICCLITTKITAQVIKIRLLDSASLAPIASVSVILDGSESGTVSDDNGFASFGKGNSMYVKILHLNYQIKNIPIQNLSTCNKSNQFDSIVA